MWALVNRTGYAVGKSWIRDASGAHLWLVAVKATFDVGRDGKVRLADEQAPTLLAPEFWGDPASSSLRHEADLWPTKTATDVLLEGSAHAPKGRPAKSVPVSLQVGDLRKSLVVHGPRVYFKFMGQISISPPVHFEVRPIRYEDAYGGADMEGPDHRRWRIDLRNPVGKGVTRDTSRLVDQPAHSIEYPSGDPKSAGPAGFGPLASFWSPRRERGGTYDEKWEKKKKPFLPDDFDEKFHLCSPDDQRPARQLHGAERVVLSNLTPEGFLSFEIPKIFLTFSTHFGARREEHRARLGSVLIASDTKKLTLVWQSSLAVRGQDVDYLDRTVIAEKPYLT